VKRWRWDWPLIRVAALVVEALEADREEVLELWDRWDGMTPG
jgi:hypothetical protein